MKKLDVKTMVTCAALIAAAIVLSRFLSINAWNLKIGFTFVPVFLAAYLYGPLGGAIVGGIADFLGATLFPIGAYFPGFTLTCVLTVASEKTDTATYFNCCRNRTTDLRTANQYLLDFCFIRIPVRSTAGYKICTVSDHDPGRVYHYRNPQQIAGTLQKCADTCSIKPETRVGSPLRCSRTITWGHVLLQASCSDRSGKMEECKRER